jgi:tRNA (guanine37-N1)-methyltransferase
MAGRPERSRSADESPPGRGGVPSRTPLRIDILTTFPELFGDAPAGGGGGGALNSSIPARARQAGVVSWHATNIRDFAGDKHAKTDDRPFGGGPGMVMKCQPLYDAVMAVEALDARYATRILLTPQGRPLTQQIVEMLAQKPRLLLLCGHYEGIDERVIEKLDPLEISIGDYVLSGGELAAMVLIDAVVRLLPGALGHEESASLDSFCPVGPMCARLLDCAHYTRPRVWEGVEVPEVLLSGDHAAVDRWRHQQRLERTRARRPDLLAPTSPDTTEHASNSATIKALSAAVPPRAPSAPAPSAKAPAPASRAQRVRRVKGKKSGKIDPDASER